MKVIFKNSNLVFEKNAQKVSISNYDAFFASLMGDTGNLGGVDADPSKEKRVKVYNVSAFAGKKLNVKTYFNSIPDSWTDKIMFAFYTTAVTSADKNASNTLLATNGCLSTNNLTKNWNWKPSASPVSCEISGEITIPAGTVAMSIWAGPSQYTGVAYPDNSEVFYYE